MNQFEISPEIMTKKTPSILDLLKGFFKSDFNKFHFIYKKQIHGHARRSRSIFEL